MEKNSVFGAGLEIKGGVRYAGQLDIHGKLDGELRGAKDSVVVIQSDARIRGNIFVDRMEVHGDVEGNGTIGTVVVRKGGRVHGNLVIGTQTCEEGGELSGKITPAKATPDSPEAEKPSSPAENMAAANS